MSRTRTLLLFSLTAAFVSTTQAAYLDLTGTPPLSGSIVGSTTGGTATAVYTTNLSQPTGSGVIDPFVRINPGGSAIVEQGFNTDFRPLIGDLADVDNTATFTHSVKVNEFGTLINPLGDGINYVRFLLDINESNGQNEELLVMNEFRVYTAASPNLNTNAAVFGSHLIYNMRGNDPNNGVLLDYNNNSGSGSGDLYVYVPAALFAGLGNQYLYLYSKFGDNAASGSLPALDTDYRASDGYEEWARVSGDGGGTGNEIPEPSQFLGILAIGGFSAVQYWRRRRAQRSA